MSPKKVASKDSKPVNKPVKPSAGVIGGTQKKRQVAKKDATVEAAAPVAAKKPLQLDGPDTQSVMIQRLMQEHNLTLEVATAALLEIQASTSVAPTPPRKQQKLSAISAEKAPQSDSQQST